MARKSHNMMDLALRSMAQAESVKELADRVCAEAKAEGRVDYAAQVARINVKAGKDSVELRLHWWSLQNTAVLSKAEIDQLIARLKEAKAKVWPAKAATASDEEDPYDIG